LRTELPRLQDSLGLEERVLYTDCDVFFRRDPVAQISAVKCEYFAVAPEFAVADYENMNTGVMWMNLPGLLSRDDEFKKFIRQNIDEWQTAAWDQGAYRRFFRGNNGAPLWEKLAPELNWKPYWGDYANASIIHFHGPKPFQRDYIDSHFSELKHLTGGSFEELCDVWKELLADAK
jgi:lipopolysaccharide biosynthesis glycosyltransferase